MHLAAQGGSRHFTRCVCGAGSDRAQPQTRAGPALAMATRCRQVDPYYHLIHHCSLVSLKQSASLSALILESLQSREYSTMGNALKVRNEGHQPSPSFLSRFWRNGSDLTYPTFKTQGPGQRLIQRLTIGSPLPVLRALQASQRELSSST